MVAEFRARRDLIVDGLNAIPGIACLRPAGAFYVFPDVSGTGLSGADFANRLLSEAGVSALAGTAFGGVSIGHIRLSYANSQANIREGPRADRDLRGEGGGPGVAAPPPTAVQPPTAIQPRTTNLHRQGPMQRLGLERELVDATVYEHTVARFREARIALPTFAQLADPSRIPPRVRAALPAVGPDAATP